MKRRDVLKGLAVGAGAGVGTIAAPAIISAQPLINWRLNNWYPTGLPFYSSGPGSATDFAKRVEVATGGRMKMQVFGAGELVPPNEGFDATASGTVEATWGCAYFWTGKNFATQYFTAVPFGLNFQGVNGWFYAGGGLQLYHELYDKFGLIAFPAGNSGVQMTGWFKKPVTTVEDFKGLKMRIPGLAGRVYQSLGVEVRLLPTGEIFPALERGVLDAAEFVGPYLDRRLGFHKAAKYYYTTGWHETATVTELMINKAAWMKLPAEVQEIIQLTAATCNVLSEAWCQANNAEAMEDLVKNNGVIAQPLPDAVVEALRAANTKILDEAVAKDPFVKKVHESYMSYMSKFRAWSALSERVYHNKILSSNA